jgi:hypothetical protein
MKSKGYNSRLPQAAKRYRSRYLNKKFENLDESGTRIIINHLLNDVLGYKELVEIHTEYPILGGIVDYLIEVDNKKLFVVEAKSIKIRLSSKHLRQAIYYGVTTGTTWVILTNARQLDLYRINYSKPITVKQVLSLDLSNTNHLKMLSKINRRTAIKTNMKDLIKV